MENCTKLKTGKNSKWDKNSKINKKWNLEVKKFKIDQNQNLAIYLTLICSTFFHIYQEKYSIKIILRK